MKDDFRILFTSIIALFIIGIDPVFSYSCRAVQFQKGSCTGGDEQCSGKPGPEIEFSFR